VTSACALIVNVTEIIHKALQHTVRLVEECFFIACIICHGLLTCYQVRSEVFLVRSENTERKGGTNGRKKILLVKAAT